MAHSDSEDEVEAIDDLDFDVSEPEDVNEEYIMNGDGEAEEGTSGAEEVCPDHCLFRFDYLDANLGIWFWGLRRRWGWG